MQTEPALYLPRFHPASHQARSVKKGKNEIGIGKHQTARTPTLPALHRTTGSTQAHVARPRSFTEGATSTMSTLHVNGREHTVSVDPSTPILWTLRDTLGMTGT